MRCNKKNNIVRQVGSQCQTQSGVRPHFRNVRFFQSFLFSSSSSSLFYCCCRCCRCCGCFLACKTLGFVIVRHGNFYPFLRHRSKHMARNRIPCVCVSLASKNKNYIHSCIQALARTCAATQVCLLASSTVRPSMPDGDDDDETWYIIPMLQDRTAK